MKTVKIVMAMSVLLAGLGSIPAADAQDAKPQPDIRMLLTQPSNRVAAPDAPPTPELRDLPQAKMDKLSDRPAPITVILGDPRCYPGEDGMMDPRQLRSSRSRRPH